ncbi:hypothetical protein [Pseudomonas cerasi]
MSSVSYDDITSLQSRLPVVLEQLKAQNQAVSTAADFTAASTHHPLQL